MIEFFQISAIDMSCNAINSFFFEESDAANDSSVAEMSFPSRTPNREASATTRWLPENQRYAASAHRASQPLWAALHSPGHSGGAWRGAAS